MLRTDVATIAALVELVLIVSLAIASSLARAGRRTRLAALEQLLVRAAEGDFSEEYDSEEPSDAIARVGLAYNRVRAQLASMVLTDPLTGCVNRRGFDRALVREVARCSRAGSELSLLALDIDHFKNVNDTLGHPAGDAVLREVGAFLCQAARAGDVVARTGGEEFALILPDTLATGATHLAARLCDLLRAQRFGSEAGLTVSIGVVSTGAPFAGHADDIAEVLKGRADEALYAAKRAGRNRVRAWAPSDEQIALGALS
jgi:diguanylate cyclase (GGDEF)-like protein